MNVTRYAFVRHALRKFAVQVSEIFPVAQVSLRAVAVRKAAGSKAKECGAGFLPFGLSLDHVADAGDCPASKSAAAISSSDDDSNDDENDDNDGMDEDDDG